MDDKEALKKNVIHALFNSEKNNIEKLEEYTYDADILDKDISKLLNKIVSPKFIQKNNIDNILDKLRIEFDEKLLVSKGKLSFKNPIKKDIKEATLKLLQATIKDEKSLSKILVNEEDITPFQKAIYHPTDFSQLITQISSNEENSLNFIMNNGAIAQSVQVYTADGKAPIIASDLKDGFIIDKQYLLKYLLPIFNGFIWNEEGKFPIMFAPKNPKVLDGENNYAHNISLLIDISGSMEKDFSVYKNNILKILDKLAEIPNWQINIVVFNDESTARSFSNQENNIEDIKVYINNLKANGYTKLYGTIKEALESFKGKIDESSTLIVFTDGKDEGTNSNVTEKDVVDVTSEVIKNPQFNMYTVGFGQYYNQEFFEQVATRGGFTHVSLNDPTGMHQLQQYIDNIEQKVTTFEIITEELKLITRVKAGDVFIGGEVNISEGNEFHMNGQPFSIGTENHEVETIGISEYVA
ncbi:vWA domain-containing protein [Rickettsia bellii]|uniref:von Willebrand factor type A domain protein n=1 Tax=Rickettsia bellii str. RML Mogi TaxID=1359194 RepID=A0A0F3QI90_RICBE|nr:vWA domain-containing protein [Rickettsia bellii]KJV92263.1 von Willebrand factor type A domain protein [Rickettsia bellii str. RML Mogi]